MRRLLKVSASLVASLVVGIGGGFLLRWIVEPERKPVPVVPLQIDVAGRKKPAVKPPAVPDAGAASAADALSGDGSRGAGDASASVDSATSDS